MSTPSSGAADVRRLHRDALLSPLSLSVDVLAAMLNFELADHASYDGGELQWFDDDAHGRGMLAFLSRRADRRVDYYMQRGLDLDPGGYEIGGGTGSWTETDFDVAHLEVFDDGVAAEVRFTDLDGHLIDIRVDDRDGRPRRRSGLLAPVGAGIERPNSLFLVWMPGFDLVRATGSPPRIRIDGEDMATGRLPGAGLHHRHLIKYASPVISVQVNRAYEGPLSGVCPPRAEMPPEHSGVAPITAERAGHHARLVVHPAHPDVTGLVDGAAEDGRWHVEVDNRRLTGGSWSAVRTDSRVELALDVDERWRPGRVPWLMGLVTTAMPVFRRWPTTYSWRAVVELEPTPVMTSRWERTAPPQAQGAATAARRARDDKDASRHASPAAMAPEPLIAT